MTSAARRPERPDPTGPATRWAVAACGLLLAVGCATSPDGDTEFTVPELDLRVQHYLGDALTGPSSAGIDRVVAEVTPGVASPKTPETTTVALECRVFYLERLVERLEPLSSHLELVIGILDYRPVLPITALGAGARVGSGPAAKELAASLGSDSPFGRVRPLETLKALVPSGTSTIFRVASRNALSSRTAQSGDRPSPTQPTLGAETSLIVSAVTDGEVDTPLDVSLVLQDGGGPTDPITRRQLLAIEDFPELDGEPMVLLLPSVFEPGSTRALAVVLRARRIGVGNPEYAVLAAECRQKLRSTSDGLALRPLSDEAVADRSALAALRRFKSEGASARADLIFATRDPRFGLVRDLAFSGTKSVLDEFAAALPESGQISADPWPTTRTAISVLLDRVARAESGPELDALLIEHVGHLARRTSSLRATLDQSRDFDSFRARVLAENLDFLGDADPAARVRAHDWLEERGAQITGFSPLAPIEERRRTLRAVRDRNDQ